MTKDTPRTDTELFEEHWGGKHVRAEFARTLERELNAAMARVKELEADARRWDHGLKYGFPWRGQQWIAHDFAGRKHFAADANKAQDAAIAAIDSPLPP